LQDSGFKKKDKCRNLSKDNSFYTRGGEPKVMKKVVNSVLASALALSVAPMVVGAEEAAPKMDANLEKVVKRLEALGLVQGYGNGEYGTDRQITRAEFATLVVRARGLESGAKLAQFNKYFKDVNSSDWFAGYVNVANGQEIIKGYEDKTFKASNNVTYAEAVAMLVRALGYEPAVKGTWPNNYIAKASELGISKNVTIDANKAATRGDIFKMLDNSLTVDIMKQTSFGSNNDYRAVPNTTLLSEYLDVEVYDMKWARTDDNEPSDLPFVSNVPVTGLGTLKGNEVEFTAPSNSIKGAKYKVADGINPNDYAGQHVQVWVKEGRDNVVVWMEGSEDESLVKDTIDDFFYNGKVLDDSNIDKVTDLDLNKLELRVGEGKTYDFASDVRVSFNFERFKNAKEALREVISVVDAFSVKAVLNDKGEIAYLSVVDDRSADKDSREYNKFGSEVIEKVDAAKQKITTLKGSNFDLKDKEEGKDFLVFVDGKPAKLADLKPMDVYSVYYADGNRDKYLVFANRTVVEGKIDEVLSHADGDNRIKVGDKVYRFRKASFSEDGNKNVDDITQEDIRDLDGVEVKLYLDPTGRVRHIETKTNVNDRTFKAIVTKQAVYDQLEDKYSFNVYTEKGAKQTVKVEKEDIEKYVYNATTKKGEFDEVTSAEALSLLTPKKDTPAVVEISLDSKGEVDKVRILDTKVGSGVGVRDDEDLTVGFLTDDAWDKAADEDDLVLTHNGKSFSVNDNTIVFDLTGKIEGENRKELKDVSTAKFKSIADDDDISVYYIVNEDTKEVEYAFVTDGDSISADKAYGLVKSVKTKGGDTYVTFLTKVDNEVKEVEYKVDGDLDDADDANLVRTNLVQYSLNGSNEVDPSDVVVIVDTMGEEPVDTKVIEDAADAELDFVTTGLVEDIDGRTVTLKGLDKNGKEVTRTVVTSSSTVYFDYTSKIDGIEEGDYVVLFDTDDDGQAIDYVLFVTDEDEVEDYEYDMTAFLTQEEGVVTPPDTDTKVPTYAATSATVKDVLIANQYTVAGKFSNYTNGTAKITIGSKTQNLTIGADGSFKAEALVKKTETVNSYTIVLSQGNKEYTFTGNFK
jgi:hypothetical protein